MKKKLLLLGASIVAFGMMAGCDSMGQAQPGESPDKIKAEVEKQDPLQQIRNLEFAPISEAEKTKQIKALEDKYHVKREDAMKNLPPVKFSNEKPPEVPTGK